MPSTYVLKRVDVLRGGDCLCFLQPLQNSLLAPKTLRDFASSSLPLYVSTCFLEEQNEQNSYKFINKSPYPQIVISS